jgi:hypothetical protein
MSSPASGPILLHLAAAYRTNPQAEVSGVELQIALDLDGATVRAAAAELAAAGLVEWDPLLTNIWLRITDLGLTLADRQSP